MIDKTSMRALTLWQPWAWGISDLPERRAKRIENRSWAPPPWTRDVVLAIHAGAAYDRAGADWIEERFGIDVPRQDLPHKAVVAVARYGGVVTHSRSAWFVGPLGWVLEHVVRLPTPVFCRGAQGLWIPPTHVQQAVLGQVPVGHPVLRAA